jgi:hypothetical protein
MTAIAITNKPWHRRQAMAQSDIPDTPQPNEDDQAWSFSHAFPRAIRLPPDVLKTWWERVLAVVAVSMAVWTVADIVLNGL